MEPEIHVNRISNGAKTQHPNSAEEFEMVEVYSTCYTSLRDIISTTSTSTAGVSTPPMPASPPSMKSSWDDIPIKNPLLKHAALAYLQPMSTPPEIDRRRGWGRRMKDALSRCCLAGCVEGVVWWAIKGKIWRRDHED